MAKTSEKTIQISQPRWQAVFRSMQDSLLLRGLGSLVNSPLNFFPGWADIQKIAQRHWLRRLPAILAASVLLLLFMSIFGIGQEELVLTAFVSLAGLACFASLGSVR